MTKNQQIAIRLLLDSLTDDQWMALSCLLNFDDNCSTSRESKEEALSAATEFKSLEEVEDLVNNAKEEGYDAGYESGSSAADDSYSEGYTEGYSVGYTEGYEEGYDKGREDGFEDGVEEGRRNPA